MTTRLRGNLVLITALFVVCVAEGSVHADQAQDQFAVAAGHYSARRWRLAAEELTEFLAHYPSHPKAANARFFLGEALLQTPNYASAHEQFRKYLDQYPHESFARQAMFRLGEASYLAGDAPTANAELAAFLEKYPDDKLNALALAYLGEVALKLQTNAAAETYFRQALERFPDSALADDCRYGLARALEKLGRYGEARDRYQALADQADGENADDALFHLATCQYSQKQYDDAAATLATFESRFPDSELIDRARLVRAWSLFQTRRYADAAPLFEQLVPSAQVGFDAGYWLALTQKKLGNPAAAARTLRKLVQDQPQHAMAGSIHLHAGHALLACKQLDEAEAEFAAAQKLLTESSGADDCLLGLAQVALARGDYPAVEDRIAKYESKFPGGRLHAAMQRVLARGQLASGRYALAISTLQALVQPSDGQPHSEIDRRLLAEALQRDGRYEEALSTVQSLIDSSDRSIAAQAQLTQGLAFAGLAQNQPAIAALDQYLRAEPEGASAALAISEIAVCHLRLHEIAQAKQAHDWLVSKHGDSALVGPATRQLANLALAQGELAWAKELFAALTATTASEDLVRDGLFGQARVAYQQQAFAECAEKAGELVSRFAKSDAVPEALLLAGAALEKHDDLDGAQHRYAEVYQKHPKGPSAERALLAAARLHRRCQQDTEAAELFQRLVERSQDHDSLDVVLYELAWLRRDQGQFEESDRLFDQVHREFRDSSYWPDATYRLAERANERRDHSVAQQLLAELLAAKSDLPIAQYALYLAGQIAVAQQQWPEVGQSMRSLVERFPSGELAGQARFWLAEALYRQNQFADAREFFNQLATDDRFAREPWQALVALRRAQLLADAKDWPEAREIAGAIADKFPDFKQQYEVDYLLGRCLANEARFEEAREAYRRTIRSTTGGKSETAAIAQWMIGESYLHQKSYRAAIKEYLRVEILYAYPNWQAAALLQAGKCHELLDEPEQATELYARLSTQYPETHFAAEATRRLSQAKQSKPSNRS